MAPAMTPVAPAYPSPPVPASMPAAAPPSAITVTTAMANELRLYGVFCVNEFCFVNEFVAWRVKLVENPIAGIWDARFRDRWPRHAGKCTRSYDSKQSGEK